MAITWKDEAYSKIKVLNIGGTDYYIKDDAAREEIEKLAAYTKFLGVTTTTITDGATTNPVSIGGESITAKSGDIVIYGSKEFIFNGTAWAEFGDLSALADQLGDLAYNDYATSEYTPEGSISVSGSFTGSEATIEVEGTTTGTVEVSSVVSGGNYTPSGSVNVDLKTTELSQVVYGFTNGTLPTFSASLLTASVSGETLTFAEVANGFTQGTLPSYSTSTVLNGATASQPTFTGNMVDITFSGSTASFSGSYTPEFASVPTYSFVGSSATIQVSGSVSKPTT